MFPKFKWVRSSTKWGLILFLDLCASVLAFAFACVLELPHLEFAWIPVISMAAVAVGTTTIALFIFNCYRIVWRYAGASEMINVFAAYMVSLVVLSVLVGTHLVDLTMSLVVIYLFTDFGLTMVIRFHDAFRNAIVRKFGGEQKESNKNKNIIIYGAGYTGAALIKRFLENPKDGYNPVAVIDDDIEKQGDVISGVTVYGDAKRLPFVMKRFKANEVAIAITEINREELRRIYTTCHELGLEVKVVHDIATAEGTFNTDAVSLKNINIEDLLRRKEHKIDRELLDGLIKDKVVMVTGGAGSIGSELCRQALRYGCKHLVIFDHYENGMFEINEELYPEFGGKYTLVVGTVKDREKLRLVMNRHRPEIVFHAAAYKHVPMMEWNPDEAVKNNIFGTQNVIEQAEESGVKKFILISTDKAVNPANIMGASKRMAELLVESKINSKTTFAAVRFGNVLGSNGSVIPTFIKQINKGGPVTVTHKEMKRYFMSIPEAVRLVMQAGALANGGEVFVLDMGEPMYIYDLACDLIRLSGMEPNRDIRIEITGLRPGEKLFEELRFNSEDVDETRHNGIFVCKLDKINPEVLNENLGKLRTYAEEGNVEMAEKIIFSMVPATFRKH